MYGDDDHTKPTVDDKIKPNQTELVSGDNEHEDLDVWASITAQTVIKEIRNKGYHDITRDHVHITPDNGAAPYRLGIKGPASALHHKLHYAHTEGNKKLPKLKDTVDYMITFVAITAKGLIRAWCDW